MTPTLSIIIPTHNRADILRRCLDCIEKQTIKDEIEVIVVSDGPDEHTAEMMQGLTWSFLLQYFALPKSQQGVCRNAGVAKARGDLTLFIGDDIFLFPDACEKHVKAHRACTEGGTLRTSAIAVLGFTTWDPTIEITPVMQWLEKTGWQFGYPRIEQHKNDFVPSGIQHRFTYTSNCSLSTRMAYTIAFREDVSLYGWEDIEWGTRLREKDISLFYEPHAKAYHHHEITLRESLTRMEELGTSLVHIKSLVPDLDPVGEGWRKCVYHLLAPLPTMRGKHTRAFLRGIKSVHRKKPKHLSPQGSSG